MYHTHLQGKGVRELAVLTGVNPPQKQDPEADPSGETSNASPPLPPSDPVETKVPQGECPYGNSYEYAQLCQEWRSATAAEEAADLAATANTIDGVVAAFTVLGFLALIWTLWLTKKQLEIVKDDRDTARTEAARLEESTSSTLAQARRSADAMATVASAMNQNLAQVAESIAASKEMVHQQRAQIRAHISVLIGDGVYQDANNNFEAKPLIQNNGPTPARNVK